MLYTRLDACRWPTLFDPWCSRAAGSSESGNRGRICSLHQLLILCGRTVDDQKAGRADDGDEVEGQGENVADHAVLASAWSCQTYNAEFGKGVADHAAELERGALAGSRLAAALDEVLVALLSEHHVEQVGLELAEEGAREP